MPEGLLFSAKGCKIITKTQTEVSFMFKMGVIGWGGMKGPLAHETGAGTYIKAEREGRLRH